MNYETSNDMYSENPRHNRRFYGDVSYLNMFMQDCRIHKDAHDALKQKKDSSFSILITVFVLIFFATFISVALGYESITSIMFPMIFLGFFASIAYSFFLALRRKPDSETASDGINYNYITDFFSSGNIHHFDCYGKSFCIDDGKTDVNSKKISKVLAIIFIALELLLVGVFAFMSRYIPTETTTSEDIIFISLMAIIFISVPIGIVVFTFIKYLLKKQVCSERVDAVCVDVQSRISRDSDGDHHRVYRPFYYLYYNGRGYILFNKVWSNGDIPEVGDIRNDIYINPDNPLDYCKKMSLSNILFSLVFCIVFCVPAVMMYVSFLWGI